MIYENIDPIKNIESINDNFLTHPQFVISVIEKIFEEGNSNIVIKTPFETIEFSKEDYKSKNIVLDAIPKSNFLFVSLKGKQVLLTMTEFSINILDKKLETN